MPKIDLFSSFLVIIWTGLFLSACSIIQRAQHNNRGLNYLDQDKTEEAVVEFEKAIQLAPKNEKSHYNFGVAYYRQGQLEKADRRFQQAIQLDRKSRRVGKGGNSRWAP